MFSGENEALARRKTLIVLQDEMTKVLGAARELSEVYSAKLKNDSQAVNQAVEKVSEAEQNVESLRRSLTRDLAEIGTMVLNREDVLRLAYSIENIVHYIEGIVYRIASINGKVLKGLEIKELINLSIETVQKLSETVRSLTIWPHQSIELAVNVEKLEREMDHRHRSLTAKLYNDIIQVKDLIFLLDLVERIENMTDACLSASDSATILALCL